MSAFRCTLEAERRGDPMLGTAPPQTRVLLVHQPGPWGPRGLLESRCDPEVALRIDSAAAKAGMRLQAIRRPGKHEVGTPSGGYAFAIADPGAKPASVAWWRVDALEEIAVELEAGGPQRPPAHVDVAPLYLVCAHGRHDACCALRGRPVAQALQRERPGRVWETTHLSGDRFAANVLVLPAGRLYGRLLPSGAAEFVDRIDAGDVVPESMRGTIGLPPVAQAALVYAHDRLGIAAGDALTVTAVDWVADDRAVVTVATQREVVRVTIAVETTPAARLTCRGRQDAKARAYRGVDICRADASQRS